MCKFFTNFIFLDLYLNNKLYTITTYMERSYNNVVNKLNFIFLNIDKKIK